ncbi:MAG: hypothetical protein U1D55_01795 [Phycisphaerae bacterium]
MHLKVVGKLRDNQFTIRSSTGRVEVSWQITGIRQDRWAEANRIPVEEDRPAHKRGTCQHPALYSQATAPTVQHRASEPILDKPCAPARAASLNN